MKNFQLFSLFALVVGLAACSKEPLEPIAQAAPTVSSSSVFSTSASGSVSSGPQVSVVASGPVVKEARLITGFTGLEVGSIFEVVVTNGPTEKVEVETKQNLQPFVEVFKNSSNALVIKIKDNTSISGDFKLKVFVNAKTLKSISGKSLAKITSTNVLNAPDLAIVLAASSKFAGPLSVTNLTATISSNSELVLTGTAKKWDLSASSLGKATGFDFTVEDLKANLSGASKVDVTVTKTLDVKAAGFSKVTYKGVGAIVSQQLSGGSKIVKI